MNVEQQREFLARARAHRDADILIAGVYATWSGTFLGCSIGCHLRDIVPRSTTALSIQAMEDKHAIVAEHYGYPVWLAQMQDLIFEGLAVFPLTVDWHVTLATILAALPPDDGYDWDRARHLVSARILRLVIPHAGRVRAKVANVAALHERAARGLRVMPRQWHQAEIRFTNRFFLSPPEREASCAAFAAITDDTTPMITSASRCICMDSRLAMPRVFAKISDAVVGALVHVAE